MSLFAASAAAGMESPGSSPLHRGPDLASPDVVLRGDCSGNVPRPAARSVHSVYQTGFAATIARAVNKAGDAASEDGRSGAGYEALDRELSAEETETLGCYQDFKRKVSLLLNDPDSSRLACTVHYAIVTLIAFSTTFAVMETVREFQDTYRSSISVVEVVFTACFTVEICARLWTSERVVAYCCSPSNLIDVLGTMPWYLEQAVHIIVTNNPTKRERLTGSLSALRVVRMVRTVRILRVLRVAKAARHSETIGVVLESIGDSLEGIFVLVFLIGMGCVATGSLIYAVELDNPNGKFASVPLSMWWSMTTITTVGYGDVVPASPLGKIVACFAMVFGLIIVSVSVATITTSFTESYNRRTVLTKLSKAAKKNKASKKKRPLAHPSEDPEAAGTPERATPRDVQDSGNAPEYLSDGELDVFSTFSQMEQDSKAVLMHLEAVVEGALMKETGGTLLSKGQGQLSNEAARLTLQVLHEQSATYFKTAMRFVEILAETDSMKDALVVPLQAPAVGRVLTDLVRPRSRRGSHAEVGGPVRSRRNSNSEGTTPSGSNMPPL